MKPNIHPKYNKLLVQLPRGDSFETYSTYGQGKLILDVDYRNHPAWTKTGISEANASSAKVSKFNKKFGNINFSSASSPKKSDEPKVVVQKKIELKEVESKEVESKTPEVKESE